MKKYFLLFFLISQLRSKADVRLPSVISDNMVLQQNSLVKFWGWGNPAEKVFITAAWNNKTDSTKTNGNGKWQMMIQTPLAGGPYTITIRGNNTIVLKNVLVGEVWIAAGQSNMEMNYNWGLPQMKADLPGAYNANIRFFNIPKTTAETPQEDIRAAWNVCDSNTVKSFSAVAYYFGKKLNADLNIPIGLIDASWGGTPAEVWTPAEVVNTDQTLSDAAKKLSPSGNWPITPGYTYNGMIAPLTEYSIAGAIWYQGESNTGTASTYHPLFSSLIQAWRKKWKKEFPFYYVQLAPYAYGNKNIAALLREAQTKTLQLPNTGMAVINDLPVDTSDIHPRDKRSVGYRLANIALADTYNQDIPAKSPLYKSMRVNKAQITLSFANASTLTQQGKTITGLFIAGNDQNFYPAQAKIVGNTVVVWNQQVLEPVAVRYAFSNTAIGNVFSREGLPVAPFRTDNWPVDTAPVK